MIEAVTNTQKYFQSPKNYFWRWGDNGQVIEWMNGDTICYRDELTGILNELSNEGFPPVGSLFMILFACRQKIHVQQAFFLMRLKNHFEDPFLEKLLDESILFLKHINTLPEDLRTGKQRIHLLYEVFEKTGFTFTNQQLKDAVSELNSGRIDELILKEGPAITKEQFKTDLQYLSEALQKFPTVESLELKLRTGLKDIPPSTEVIIPEKSPVNIFDQLANDAKTIGVARLAKRLIAALNIPMHSQGSGDQSYGGIADITNRGNYDKLLLSELAQDDVSLTARLVNNEALYYRREEPPDNPKRQRTILIDTTLKMWGVPRVFALSAALACTQNTKNNELVQAYTLGGEQYRQVDLETKEGIIQSQEILHHSLHCGKALQAAVNEVAATEQNDFIFITDAAMFYSPVFHAYLSRVKEALSFILTVNRNGELQFFECIKGKTKLLSTAKFDLEELLFTTDRLPVKKPASGDEWRPAFLSQLPAPLLFPVVKIKRGYNKLHIVDGSGIAVVNESQRLLYVQQKRKGAFELLNYIEKGSYCFGIINSTVLFVLLYNYQRNFAKLYSVDLITKEVNIKPLPLQIEKIRGCFFKEGRFLIANDLALYSYNCETGELSSQDQHGFNHPGIFDIATTFSEDDKKLFAIITDVSYSAMYKIRQIGISKERCLVLGDYTLMVLGNQNIRIFENTRQYSHEKTAKLLSAQPKLLQNKHISFKCYQWEDGSEILVDHRGILHLKSSDKSLPEVSIVCVTGTDTACWASDGTTAGADYFIHHDKVKTIPAQDFYNQYIQPYINRILKS